MHPFYEISYLKVPLYLFRHNINTKLQCGLAFKFFSISSQSCENYNILNHIVAHVLYFLV